MAREASCTCVTIETDCRMVADLANNKVSNKSQIWWTIAEIHSSKLDFQSITFQHIPKHCNASAHYLVKRALQSSESAIRKDQFPVDVLCMLDSFRNKLKGLFSFLKKTQCIKVMNLLLNNDCLGKISSF